MTSSFRCHTVLVGSLTTCQVARVVPVMQRSLGSGASLLSEIASNARLAFDSGRFYNINRNAVTRHVAACLQFVEQASRQQDILEGSHKSFRVVSLL